MPTRPAAHCYCLILILVLCCTLLLAGAAAAQTATKITGTEKEAPAKDTGQPRFGEITGHVISDDGQAVANARVSATAMGSANAFTYATSTDAEGNFRFPDLPRATYSLFASSPGYIPTASFVPANERPVYRLGEVATILLAKGGVITGLVTDIRGMPIPSLSIRALRIRDAEGNPIAPSSTARDRNTDDRGRYRLYGLVPGTYVVMAMSQNRSGGTSEHEGKAPTFHPADPRDTAVEITVRSGEEVSGIDIRFRSEPGYIVSGLLTGNFTSSDANTTASIELRHAETGTPVGLASAQLVEGKRGFVIYGVADGEYEISAQRYGTGELDSLVSRPRRISVNGAAVSGVELRMNTLGSIAGRVITASKGPTANAATCLGKDSVQAQDITLTVRRSAHATGEPTTFPRWDYALTTLDNKSEYLLRNLMAAHYRFAIRLPDENLYVRSITTVGVANQLVDIGRNGISLKSGEKAKEITVNIASGAAAVSGRVTIAGEGLKLPQGLQVHFIPAEPEHADDVLRYAQTTAQGDGSFSLTNLAPGKYWLLTRVTSDSPSIVVVQLPLAWDNKERAKLRREAMALKLEIVLQPCQLLHDYILIQPQ